MAGMWLMAKKVSLIWQAEPRLLGGSGRPASQTAHAASGSQLHGRECYTATISSSPPVPTSLIQEHWTCSLSPDGRPATTLMLD